MLIRELDKVVNLTLSRSILENQTSDQYDAILKDFIKNDIKIIIGIFDISTTVRLFCKIYKNNMYGENYQWIILGAYNKEIISSQFINDTECSTEELLTALNGTLQTRVVQYSHEYELKSKSKKIKNPNICLLEKEYLSIVDSYMASFSRNLGKNVFDQKEKCFNSYFHGYAFDLMLAIFKILGDLIEADKFSCSFLDFHRDINWFASLNEAFKKISFKGVTVSVFCFLFKFFRSQNVQV